MVLLPDERPELRYDRRVPELVEERALLWPRQLGFRPHLGSSARICLAESSDLTTVEP